MIKGSVIALFILLSANSLFSQAETELKLSKPGFRSLQLDFTSIILINTFTGCVDFDFYSDGKKGSAGLRAGVDYYVIGDVGGGTRNGSPCTDFDFLARATLSDRVLRVDVYGGLNYHSTSKGSEPGGVFFKFGLDIKARIYKDYIGFIGKLGATKVAYGGIGIFIGYGK